MSFRFLRISSNFKAYLAAFYVEHPGLAERPYAEQLAAHLYNAFERSDFYSVELRKLGYEAEEIIADVEPLQKQWACEQGVPYREAFWIRDITLAQIASYQPEVLLITAWLPVFDAEYVREAHARCSSLKLVIGWVGEAIRPPTVFLEHDLVLSCAQDTVTFMQSNGLPARQFHHAFAPQVLDRLEALPPRTEPMPDLGFIGNLDFGDRFHNRRVRMFHDIAQQMDFTLYGLMAGVVYKRRGPIRYVRQAYYAMFEAMHRLHLESVARRLPHYGVWRRVKEHKPYVPFFSFLEPRLRPPVFGLEMYQVLSRLKIGLNAHGPSTYASNMRLFETTGVGTCLLTDWKPNLPDLFEPDSEVVDYRSPEEAVEKARYLLDHPAEREAIATAGQRRTLRDHTYTQRAEELDAVITDQLRSGHSR